MAYATQQAGRTGSGAEVISLEERRARRNNLTRSLMNEEEQRTERALRRRWLEARSLGDRDAQQELIREYCAYQKELKTRVALSRS